MPSPRADSVCRFFAARSVRGWPQWQPRRSTAEYHLHRFGRSGLEGCRISWLRHQDAEHRPSGGNGRGADAVLRAADVLADARRDANGPLPTPYRDADGGHSLGGPLWGADRRMAPAPGAERRRIRDCARREMAHRPRQARILATSARLRLFLWRDGGRDRPFQARSAWRGRLVSQQRSH